MTQAILICTLVVYNYKHLVGSLKTKCLKLRWQDKIPYTKVLMKAGMQSLHTLLKLAQLRWTGHVTIMPEERLSKKIFYGELQEGKWSQAEGPGTFFFFFFTNIEQK